MLWFLIYIVVAILPHGRLYIGYDHTHPMWELYFGIKMMNHEAPYTCGATFYADGWS